MSRRNFVAQAGLYAATLPLLARRPMSASAAVTVQAPAGNFGSVDPSHHVPLDKKLSRDWLDALVAKGEPQVYRGEELRFIGMPVGGVGAGQLYLGGDGRLMHWDIFNRHVDTGAKGYTPHEPEQPVSQGFALRLTDGDATTDRTLDAAGFKAGFKNVRFVGEYPIGRVEYRDDDLPVQTTLEAFSPFIPLNARDSALPATVMRFSLKNTSDRPVKATIAGWLANAVCMNEPPAGTWQNRVTADNGLTFAQLGFAPKEPVEKPEPREPVAFADFEQKDYGDWKVEGKAFGIGPATGTLPHQQHVHGFQGKRLVNSFGGGDDATGKLTSPAFTIERQFINFLIGGGNDIDHVGMRLVVDGKTVRSVTGRNSEELQWSTWDVSELAGQKAHLEIYDDRGGPWGHVNIDQIEFADEPHVEPVPTRERGDFGTMGLGLIGDTDGLVKSATLSEDDRLKSLFAGGEASDTATTACREVGLGRTVTLPPGETREIAFVVAWHFPNHDQHGRFYDNAFDDALGVAKYLADNLASLSEQTHLWHDTYYDSTLPAWLLDRVHMPISILATSTCQWWKNGRFWAWEGVGCCAGTCTHVWNYEQAMARLFPQLEQSVRSMQDFDAGFQSDSGLVGFRGEFDLSYAADGQAGTILKAYREHLVAPDDTFLKSCWPQVKGAMRFLFAQDANLDGIIENEQHNTYDINFYGANTFVGSLYLGALRAAERMADHMGDAELAATCRKAFERGRDFSMQRLFNGEYFIQIVNPAVHPLHQYGDGCLADQLFGQNWAHQLSLGHLYPPEAARKGVESVWRYNWAPDVATQNEVHPAQRVFAIPGEPGLFICTWPKSPHPGNASVLYRDEVWTGIEYEVATGLIYEGLVTEGLAVVKAIDERYDASKRNPWNEIECGDHYARAMASWGVLLSLSGFEYDGPAGMLAMAPRISPDDFRCIFTAAEGWGTLRQVRDGAGQTNAIIVKFGRLRLADVTVTLPSPAQGHATVKVNDQTVDATTEPGDANRVTLRFAKPIVLEANDTLQVQMVAAG